MRTGETFADETGIAVEAVFTETEAQLLMSAREGQIPCPWCDRVLRGDPVTFERPDDDVYVGVRLSCSCGFMEY